MKPSGVITLTTDFGLKDPYVGEMKGVILSINPYAKIVDITHEVAKFSVREASFVLAASYSYFPRGTAHVVVVDPGVGSERKAIAVRTKNYYFVGPDNGVLMLAAEEDGVESVVEIEPGKYTRESISHTFHGRDVFAPAAAHISLGVPLEELGRGLSEWVRPSYAKPVVEEGAVRCEVVYVDSFGNVILNVRETDLQRCGVGLGARLSVRFKGIAIEVPFCRTFSDVNEGEALLYVGGHGFLELGIREGSASSSLGLELGDRIELQLKQEEERR